MLAFMHLLTTRCVYFYITHSPCIMIRVYTQSCWQSGIYTVFITRNINTCTLTSLGFFFITFFFDNLSTALFVEGARFFFCLNNGVTRTCQTIFTLSCERSDEWGRYLSTLGKYLTPHRSRKIIDRVWACLLRKLFSEANGHCWKAEKAFEIIGLAGLDG